MKIINACVPTVYQGKKYDGISIYPGVSITFEALPCVADKTNIVFTGTSVKPKVFVEGITSVEESDIAGDRYEFLQIPNDEA
jgi:pantothenate kinase type III